jgi:hypothetical protein
MCYDVHEKMYEWQGSCDCTCAHTWEWVTHEFPRYTPPASGVLSSCIPGPWLALSVYHPLFPRTTQAAWCHSLSRASLIGFRWAVVAICPHGGVFGLCLLVSPLASGAWHQEKKWRSVFRLASHGMVGQSWSSLCQSVALICKSASEVCCRNSLWSSLLLWFSPGAGWNAGAGNQVCCGFCLVLSWVLPREWQPTAYLPHPSSPLYAFSLRSTLL